MMSLWRWSGWRGESRMQPHGQKGRALAKTGGMALDFARTWRYSIRFLSPPTVIW